MLGGVQQTGRRPPLQNYFRVTTQASGASGDLLVAISTNVTSAVDYVPIDANGDFIDTPASLPYGSVTATATLEQFNAAQGIYLAVGSPQQLTFTYQQQTETAPTLTAVGLQDSSTGGLDAETSGNPPSSSSPVIGGQVSYQGKLQGITVEIDTTGGGTPDATATTNQYGQFTFTPTGVSAGNTYTYQIRAEAVDDQTGQMLAGNWQPFTFSVTAPTAAPPTIASLTLATSTTDASGNLDTTDSTVTGSVTGPSSVAGLTVQFMVAGAIVGSTTTDSSGGFVYTPSGLTPGSVSIEARVVDTDAGGNVIDGAWSSALVFTLQAAPVVGTSVSKLQLVDGSAQPLSMPLTTAPTIAGQITSGTNAVGVTVELDVNGDGIPDFTTTTDGQGDFTFTPTGLPDGVDTVRARAVISGTVVAGSPDPANGTYSDWVSLSFVVTSDPTDPTAQSQAAALAAASAPSSSSTSGSTAQQTFASSEQTASAAYRQAVAQDAAGKQAVSDAAQAVYNTAVAQATSAYNADRATAAASYAQALGNPPSNEDTTTYVLPNPNGSSAGPNGSNMDFSWPTAPAGPSVPDTANQTGPAPPQEAPLDGPTFDPTSDPGYQSTLAAAQTVYDTAATAANNGYSSTVSTAEATYQTGSGHGRRRTPGGVQRGRRRLPNRAGSAE
jgi:hypothetical protein